MRVVGLRSVHGSSLVVLRLFVGYVGHEYIHVLCSPPTTTSTEIASVSAMTRSPLLNTVIQLSTPRQILTLTIRYSSQSSDVRLLSGATSSSITAADSSTRWNFGNSSHNCSQNPMHNAP